MERHISDILRRRTEMSKVRVVYGSTTGNTCSAAEKIARKIGDDTQVVDVAKATDAEFTGSDLLIFGTSTWGLGDIQDDWMDALPTLRGANLAGKHFAVFGLGDQSVYPDTFVDGMRDIYDAAVQAGATPIGSWSKDGYDFEESRAEIDGRFIGLVLDEENQSDLSDTRIEEWVSLLKQERGIA
jgi:flavodoxin I